MAKKQNTKFKGFTIIEVVLVLAIAGLIMLMVFIALPALQRSQRDTQRRSDFSRFASQIASYQANNRNRLPETQKEWTSFVDAYLKANGDTFADPDGTDYVVTLKSSLPTDGILKNVTFPNAHQVLVYANATCEGEKVIPSTGTRKVAFQYKLEGGGVYCGNN